MLSMLLLALLTFHSTSSHASTTFRRHELFIVWNRRGIEELEGQLIPSLHTRQRQQQQQTIENPVAKISLSAAELRGFVNDFVVRF